MLFKCGLKSPEEGISSLLRGSILSQTSPGRLGAATAKAMGQGADSLTPIYPMRVLAVGREGERLVRQAGSAGPCIPCTV